MRVMAEDPDDLAHLRLVRQEPDAVGPVSPELVMVSPQLADVMRPLPDTLELGAGDARAEPEQLPRREPPPHGKRDVRFDTRELLLERHGLVLELRNPPDEPWWVLTLPRGETVSGPGATPPREIASLLRTLVREAPLVRVPARSANPQLLELERHVSEQRASLLAHEPGVRIASDLENLHQLRVASRRVRSFLRVARELVDEAWREETDVGLRAVLGASGDARDLDVLIARLREELPTVPTEEQADAAQLVAELEADRDALQPALLDTLDSDRHRGLLDRLALPIEEASPSSSETLEHLAARELRRLLKRVRALGSTPRDEELHRLRIRVKRVRYAVELGGLPGGKAAQRAVKRATQLQDVLGAHQDASVAEGLLRALAERSSPRAAFVAGRLAERRRVERERLQAQLPAAWKKLFRAAR
jgi:CHAD domain-containing protein